MRISYIVGVLTTLRHHSSVSGLDLLESTANNPQHIEQIHQVQSSATLLMSITNDLLDFSKLESGRLQIEDEPLSLGTVATNCIRAVQQEALQKGLSLKGPDTAQMARLPPEIMGDADRLRQILLNLLDNAMKFTERGGTVCLQVEAVHNQTAIQFRIIDTGMGISSDVQEYIFDKYRKTSSTKNYGGSGLGLAICRGLLDVMKGDIWVESEIGVGSTFLFEIPVRLPPISRAPKLSRIARMPSTSSDEGLKPLKILVVEDNKVNQKLVRSMLQRMGHSVSIAENGQIGVDKVQEEYFDLVLMDHMMPVMDGIEATKAIREMGLDKSKLPIVGLTASYQHSELDTYLEVGMNDCLGKPVKLALLKDAITQAVSLSGR